MSIRHCTVYRRSIAAALGSSLADEELLRRPLKSRSRRAVNCRRRTVIPYLAITTPATRHAPPRPLVRLVVTLPLLTPLPPICRRLSLRPSPFVPLVRPAGCPVSSLLTPPPPICRRLRLSSHRHLLLSRPSQASCPCTWFGCTHATYQGRGQSRSTPWLRRK